jgi:hypothetical protein
MKERKRRKAIGCGLGLAAFPNNFIKDKENILEKYKSQYFLEKITDGKS